MLDKKYKILKDNFIKTYEGKKLYRIQALKDIIRKNQTVVKKGSIGGFVESEKNLSQKGSCWLYNDTSVEGNAKVLEDAKVKGTSAVLDNSIVKGSAIIRGHVQIKDDAQILDNSFIEGNVEIQNKAVVSDYAYIEGDVYISGSAFIGGNARLYGDEIQIFGNASVTGESFLKGAIMIKDNSKISGHSLITALSRDFYAIHDNIIIEKNAEVKDARIEGYVKITDNAKVFNNANIYGTSNLLIQTIVCGDSQINGEYTVKYGIHREIESKDFESIIYHVFGFYPTNGKIILYKLVNKDNSSIYNNCDFVFPEKGKVKRKDLKDYKTDEKFHFSTPEYWEYGSTFNQHKLLIAEIKIKDIKKIVGEVIIPKKVKIVGCIDKY
jgi:carbonic anhydrase/acetyltransferase-like protein (isoleucine patch superfamily)